MPHEKMKSENYQNMGGINTKASQYATGPMEFLDIRNFDFQTPAALTKRWGSTQYMGATLSGTVNFLYEYEETTGYSAIMFALGSSIYQHYGTGFTSLGLPQAAGSSQFLDQTQYSFGATTLSSTTLRFGPPTEYSTHTTFYIYPTTPSLNYKDAVTYNNTAIVGDGNALFKVDGLSLTRYQLPQAGWGFTDFGSPSIADNNPSNAFYTNGGPPLALDYTFGAAYKNTNGFLGPIGVLGEFISGGTYFAAGGLTFNAFNPQFLLAVPLGYGVTSVVTFFRPGRIKDGGLFWMGTEAAIAAGGTFATPLIFRSANPDGKSAGATLPPESERIYDLGENSILMSAIGATLSGATYTPGYDGARYPSHIEVYNNSVFFSGFSLQPSHVYFTDLAEVEQMIPENFFEVRTNDGDKVTGQRSYNNRLYVFKENSFHALSGDDPSNYQLRQISDEYGCLNNRSVAVYNNIMMFLDKKGIMRFDGSNYEIITTKIQPIFQRMNLSAARSVAIMVHDKPRNQILCAIPVDGSTTNNLTVVYDYLVDAWTTYDGIRPSVFALAKGNFNLETTFYGGMSGLIYSYGASLFGDNGASFTSTFKTRFLHDMGESVEKQFRRLYINCDPLSGVTSALNINFYKNYGASIVYSKTMFQTPFQSRIDFGIPGKSLAFDLSNSSSTDSIRIFGFVVEYRYQRAT